MSIAENTIPNGWFSGINFDGFEAAAAAVYVGFGFYVTTLLKFKTKQSNHISREKRNVKYTIYTYSWMKGIIAVGWSLGAFYGNEIN